MSSCIQPCKALSQKGYIQIAFFQIDAVQVGNLQFPSGAWADLLRVIHNPSVVKIQTGDCIVGFWSRRFFFQGNCFSLLIKLHHAETFRIIHIITEYGRTFFFSCRCFQSFAQSVSVEDIVAEDHSAAISCNKLFSKKKCLRQAVRRRLNFIFQMNPGLIPVA